MVFASNGIKKLTRWQHWHVLLLCVLLLVAQAQAQDLPLGAPLVALSTPAQDAVLLYDVRYATLRRLQWGAGIQRAWGFVADGCRVLLTLDDKLYTAKLDGDDLRALVTFDELPDSAWGVDDPQPAPDGQQVAFTFWRDTPNGRTHHIAVVPAQGGTPTVLSRTGREFTPRWSPDSSTLAYVSYRERVAGETPFATAAPTVPPPPNTTPAPLVMLNEASLWLVRVATGERFPLTGFATGSVSAPRWSPDGTLIAFIYSPQPFSDLLWMIAAQEGAIPTQLSRATTLLLDMAWTPDGTQLIFSAYRWQGTSDNRLWRTPIVGIADIDGAPYLPEHALTHADFPRFSPDGRYVAARTAYALAIVDLETNAHTLLPSWADGNTPAFWSPAAFVGESTCNK